jgi:plasmid stability protein
MAAITIRNLEDALKAKLRLRAASRGHSMEEEARAILREALEGDERGLGSLINERFMVAGGVELPSPDRGESPRKPVPPG